MNELEEIEEIDSDLDEMVLLFLIFFNREVMSRIESIVEEFLNSLDYENGLLNRMDRQRKINRFRTTLAREINSILSSGETELIANYKGIVDKANAYFLHLSNNYDKFAYKESFKQSLDILKDTLTGRGLADELAGMVIGKLKRENLLNIKRSELVKNVGTWLADANMLKSHINTLVNDTVYGVTRVFQTFIATQLGIKHWLYAGTLIKTSRAFCTNRVGMVYTTTEVESWANISWAGKIPTTNKENIFTLLGGYNCRHTLRPISESLFNEIRN